MMDSFYSVKGNEISKEAIVAEFINNYKGTLTDFNEGSEIRNLIEAFAVYAMGLEERMNDLLYVVDVMNADGEYLDLIASQPRINMERIEGVQSTGYVTFTIQHALLEDLLIPAGTVLTSDTGLDFETVTDNVILPGELSRDCMVQSIDVGVENNIPANSILTKIDGYDAVDGFTVSNPQPFIGGLDYEEDDAFRDRIIANLSLQKFGSKPYYISMLMNEFSTAHDILFDTTDENYTAVVTPNSYGSTTEQEELEQELMAYLVNENNILLGHSFTVLSPVEKEIVVTVSDEGVFSELENEVKEIITKYVTGGSLSFAVMEYSGLNLGVRIYADDLKEAIRSLFPANDYPCDLTINITDDGAFTNAQNKYKITSITFNRT